MPLSHFPKFVLAHLPTPLEPLARLHQHLGGPSLYIKRDDCTGLALGGNKTRKAEFLIGAALAASATVSFRRAAFNRIMSARQRRQRPKPGSNAISCWITMSRSTRPFIGKTETCCWIACWAP